MSRYKISGTVYDTRCQAELQDISELATGEVIKQAWLSQDVSAHRQRYPRVSVYPNKLYCSRVSYVVSSGACPGGLRVWGNPPGHTPVALRQITHASSMHNNPRPLMLF